MLKPEEILKLLKEGLSLPLPSTKFEDSHLLLSDSHHPKPLGTYASFEGGALTLRGSDLL